MDASNYKAVIDQRRTALKVRRQAKAAANMLLTLHGVAILSAELDPGGRPSTTLEVVSVATVVCTSPLESVRIRVARVGAGVTPGRAVTFGVWVTPFTTFSIRGEYVDVARSLTATTDVGTEVLNIYVGVVRVGVDTTKLGKVVETVSEREEKRAESSPGDKGTADGG